MIPIPSGVRVWIATGHTDMRRGMNGLALQVQEALKRDPHARLVWLALRLAFAIRLALGHEAVDRLPSNNFVCRWVSLLSRVGSF